MSEREAPVRFHDWRAARDRKAATRCRWRSRCIRIVAVPVSIGLAGPGAGGRHVTFYTASPIRSCAEPGSILRHRPLTYRIVKEN